MPAHFRPLLGAQVVVTTASLPGGNTGTAYSQQLAAIGGTPPYTWYLVGGALPPGLNLSSSGLISGTPTAAATFALAAQAQDVNGLCGSQMYLLTITGLTNVWFGATLPTLPTRFTTTSSPPLAANTNRGSYYTPGVGGDSGLTLQAALNAAAAATGTKGDVIVLQSGTTYTTASQAFTLPARAGSGWIYIITNTAPELSGIGLPAAGTRVTPANLAAMPSIRSSATNTGGNIVQRAVGAAFYRLVGLDIELTETNAQAGNVLFYVVLFNNLDTSTTTLANNITLDRCYIAGAPTSGCQHAVNADGKFMEVTECYIERCHQIGIGDVNCIVVVNSIGPYRFHNNYLDSQGQGTFFGGSDTTLPSPNTPNDIEITNNYYFHGFFSAQGTVANGSTTLTITSVASGVINPGMQVVALSGFIPASTQIIQQLTGTPGGVGTYQLQRAATGTSSAAEAMTGSPFGKNAVEFKVGQRVLFDSNYLDHAGTNVDLQPRTAFVLTCRNQSGTNPWYVLNDFTITNNVFTDCQVGGFNYLLQDGSADNGNGVTQASARILMRNNLFILSNPGNGTASWSMGFIQSENNTGTPGGGSNIIFDHNTFIGTPAGGVNSFLGMGGGHAMALQNVVWSNNIWDQNQFGIINVGSPSNYNSSVPPQVTQPAFINNVLLSGAGGPFPAGNFTSTQAAVGFTSYGSNTLAAGYALTSSSPYHAKGVSGTGLAFNAAGTLDGTDIGCNISTLPTKAAVTVPNKVVIAGLSGVMNNYVTSDGLTVTAYPTIAQAVAAQQPGDLIRLENGLGAPTSTPANPFVYAEQMNFKGAANGTAQNPITWIVRAGHYLELYKAFGFIATAYSAAGSAPPNGAWVNPGAGFWGQGLIHFEGNSFIKVDMRDSTGQAQALQIADAVKDNWNPVGTLANPANPATYINHHSLTYVSSHDIQLHGVHVQGANSYYAGYAGWDCYNLLFDYVWWDKHGTNNFGNAQGQAWGEMFDFYGHDSLFQYCKGTYCGHNTGPAISGFNNHAKYCDWYSDWSAYNTGALRAYAGNCGAGFLQGYVPQLPTPPPTGCTIGPVLFEYCRFVGCSSGDVSAGMPYQQFFTANCIVRNCVYAGGLAGGHNITEMNVGNSSDTHTMLLVGQNSFYNNSSLNTPFISDALDTGFTAPAHPNEYGGNRWQNNVYDGIVNNGLQRYLIFNSQSTSQCGNNPYPNVNKGNQLIGNCINGTTATTDGSGRVISRTMSFTAFVSGAPSTTFCDWTDAGNGSVPGAHATFGNDMSGNIIQQPVWTNSAAALQGGPTTGLVLADLQAALNGMTLSATAGANSNMLGTATPLVTTTAAGTNVTQIPVTPAPRMFYDGRNCPYDTPDSIAIVPAAGGNAVIVSLVAGTGVDVAGNHLNVQQVVTFGTGDKIYLVSAAGLAMTNWGLASTVAPPLQFQQVFNFASFTAANFPAGSNVGGTNIDTYGHAGFTSPNQMHILDSTVHSDAGAFYETAQNIQQFNTTFTFQFSQANFTTGNSSGFCFVIQNATAVTTPYTGYALPTKLAADANLFGYGSFWNGGGLITASGGQQLVGNSVAIKFDPTYVDGAAQPCATSGVPNTTGLYIDGGPSGSFAPYNDLNPFGINFYSGHVFSCTVVYDGTVLTWTIRDTTTGAQARFDYPINIPQIVGGNTAYVGFTGGGVNPAAIFIYINSWNFYTSGGTSLQRLLAPTFSVPAGQYASTQTVAISGPTGASIYYTVNGQPATSAGTLYSTPITVSANTFLQAVAVQNGFTDSKVAAANYLIQAATSPTINFPSGFASSAGLISQLGVSTLNGSNIQIATTDTGAGGVASIVGAAWYTSPVTISTFSGTRQCQFTFTIQNNPGSIFGMCFVIQALTPGNTYFYNNTNPNNPPPGGMNNYPAAASGGPWALGNGGAALGYSGQVGTFPSVTGFLNSVAIKFDVGGNHTNLYTATSVATDVNVGGISVSPVNLQSSTPIAATLSYDGTTLTLTLVQGANNFSHGFAVNIPSVIQSNQAWVGITSASHGGGIIISNWTGF